MMNTFQVGQVYSFTLNGQPNANKKVTKCNGSSIYFGKIRVPYETDDAGQYLVTDSGKVYAKATKNDDVKEESTMAETKKTTKKAETAKKTPAKAEKAEKAEPTATEYIIIKSTRDGKKMFGDVVTVEPNETVDNIINPLHADEKPSFVALVKLDKVLAFLSDNTIGGMTQTARNITKKWNKLQQTENGIEVDYAAVAGILNAIVEDSNRVWEAAEDEAEEENGVA